MALFASTTYFGQRAFESLRQPELEATKQFQLLEPPIEARLWEDPLAALRRHRENQKQACLVAEGETKANDERCKPIHHEKFKEHFQELSTLVIALLPGAAFARQEEARRRARYALLAGMNAAGFEPDESERMGWLRVRRCESFKECSHDSPMEIAYETLSERRKPTDGPKSRIAVLWVDSANLGRRWLTQSAMILNDLASSDRVQLRIIGPPDSDDLAAALDDLSKLAEEAKSAEGERFERNWRSLSELRLVSQISTAPESDLIGRRLAEARPDARLFQDGFKPRFEAIQKNFKESSGISLQSIGSSFFFRTIGTDDLLIKELVQELCQRGLDERAKGASRTVALISEWDSIYARSFEAALSRELEDASACRQHRKAGVRLIPYHFLRGLDGLTVEGLAKKQSQRSDEKENPRPRTSPIEWAEGGQQRDYLRRLVSERLGRDQGPGAIELQAIGIIGSDVHDKLILLQALRDEFPDRMIFTTDLDARLIHPSMLPYTRNLIVASSLPLTLDYALQCGVAPFRDVYQTAMFLAARYVALDEAPEEDRGRLCVNDKYGPKVFPKDKDTVRTYINVEVVRPRLFEIGRGGITELTNPLDAQGDRRFHAILAAIVLLALGLVMIFVRPGPAMKATRQMVFGQPSDQYPASADRVAWSTLFLAGLQIVALGFASGVLVELEFPGMLGLRGSVLIAIATGAVFWASLILFANRTTDRIAKASIQRRALLLCGLACLAALPCYLWGPRGHEEQVYEPFALFSGISAWPSELLRTLAVVLFVWFLDYAWCKVFLQADLIGQDYFPGAQEAVKAPISWRKRIRYVSAFLSGWQDKKSNEDPVDGAALWREYRMRLRGGQRLIRIAIGSILLICFLVLMQEVIGGAAPEVPARGVGDRMLFGWTLNIAGVAAMILMVVVADTTMLTWRFITLLKAGRTFYPPATVQRFAAELGPALRGRAARLMPVDLTQRGHSTGSNSLLDDWIDARLFARHTAAVGPLIIFPFVLLAVLIVARSRLFDNWQVGGFVLAAFIFLVLWSVGMAVLLNHGAEVARRVAIERMERDLLWLKGAGAKYEGLADQFPRLIEQIRNLRQGAFAPFFEQPVVQAVLVPLGGAGGIQLLELVMFARSA